jgi:hypothetical protein
MQEPSDAPSAPSRPVYSRPRIVEVCAACLGRHAEGDAVQAACSACWMVGAPDLIDHAGELLYLIHFTPSGYGIVCMVDADGELRPVRANPLAMPPLGQERDPG